MEIYKDAIHCMVDTKIKEIALLIKEHHVRHVYVVDALGKLIGIVGGVDINNKILAEGRDYRDLVAKDIMNKVEFVTTDQKIEYAYAIMRNFSTFICPVVDAGQKLIGYYKFADVCEALHKKIIIDEV